MMPPRSRILCVDDEPAILRFLEVLLVKNGYEVIKAGNGEEALQEIEKQEIDLVISDVKMPNVDGFELCRRIKGEERSRDIPVVLITGLAAKEDRIRGIEAGAEDFISKPIDPAEVLARVRMLLKTKELRERRIGELFIELGFITDDALEKALRTAKEQHIKIGEALYSIGALDKDHIYWVLSNQLNMNYVELSPEMIDQDLIRQFSIDLLGQLLCLPLYETIGEIHFAIADPTDQNIVKRVKSLKPDKAVQLHLAIPEKIADILNLFEGELPFQPQSPKMIQSERGRTLSSAKALPSGEISKTESLWGDWVSILLSMSQGETCWVYETPGKCRLISQKGKRFETLHEYPGQDYLFIRNQLKQEITSQPPGKEGRLFLQEKFTQRQGVFRLLQIDGLDRQITKIEPISSFSWEAFMRSHPQVSHVIADLRRLLNEHHYLLMGGEDRLWAKQCCYSMLKANEGLDDFPPPLLIESEADIYFPEGAQFSKDQWKGVDLLKYFKDGESPFLFYEAELSETASGGTIFSKSLLGRFKHIILYFPFASMEAMQKALLEYADWSRAGFKAVFLSQDQLKSI